MNRFHRLIALAVAFSMVAGGAAEARHHPRYHSQGSGGSTTGDYYTARSGHQVHRPVQASRAPAGASAQCRDSTWSFSESRRGTCSHHGGVSRWL
jgi:hypothetical protein